MPLLLLPAAFAHPAPLPHAHDPASYAMLGFWLLAGAGFVLALLRRPEGAGHHA